MRTFFRICLKLDLCLDTRSEEFFYGEVLLTFVLLRRSLNTVFHFLSRL